MSNILQDMSDNPTPTELTRDEAFLFYEGRKWEGMTEREIFDFQLNQPRLCVDINVFKQAAAIVLGREVPTHELLDAESLRAEYNGLTRKATAADVVAKLHPKEVHVVTL